jgi:hypothetical protein
MEKLVRIVIILTKNVRAHPMICPWCKSSNKIISGLKEKSVHHCFDAAYSKQQLRDALKIKIFEEV